MRDSPASVLFDANGNPISISSESAVRVSHTRLPVADQTISSLTRTKLFRALAKDSSSSSMLNVDGSGTPVDFIIRSSLQTTKFITSARFILHGDNFNLSRDESRGFGNVIKSKTPLSSGLEFFVTQGGVDTSIFLSPVKAAIDFMKYCNRFENFINSVAKSTDFLSLDFDFESPIILVNGSSDRITIRVQDDLEKLSLFEVYFSGYQEFV